MKNITNKIYHVTLDVMDQDKIKVVKEFLDFKYGKQSYASVIRLLIANSYSSIEDSRIKNENI